MTWRMSVFYVTLSVVPTRNSSVESSNRKSGKRFVWLGPKFRSALACHVLGSLLCACNSHKPLAMLPLMAPGRILRTEFIYSAGVDILRLNERKYSDWFDENCVTIVTHFHHHIMKARVSFNWELSDEITMDNFHTHPVFHLFRRHTFICFSQHRDWHSF